MLGINSSTIRKEVRSRGFTFDNYDAHKAHTDSAKKVSNGMNLTPLIGHRNSKDFLFFLQSKNIL
jgi:hypothetical protein